MKRCFQLAAMGTGSAAPNPLVGSVVVHDQKIIGEGYHENYGEAHAEVNAIASVKDATLLEQSTIYVNLEPCAHFGKTPPCANLIIEKKIPRVVIANIDPYAEVAGRGIQRMRDAGIEVETGICAEEGFDLNRRFFTFHQEQRAYVILKWAQTSDGFLDHVRKDQDGQSALKITGSEANRLVHRWRTEEAAILVGRNTAQLDDPRLTSRHWPGKDPLRLLIDPQLQLPNDSTLLSDGAPTIVFNAKKSETIGSVEYVQLHNPDRIAIDLLKELFNRDIQSVIVEGGASTLSQFIEADLWDEARVWTGPQRIGKGIPAPSFAHQASATSQFGEDHLSTFYRS